MSGAKLDGEDSGSALYIGSGNYLNFENITITRGKVSGLRIDGSYNNGIYGKTDITLSNGTRITRNSATGSDRGGGVYVKDATLTINGAEISKNDASYGGGLYADGNAVVVTINSGLFTANKATSSGGGIHLYGAYFIMNGGTISANEGSSGGGLYVIGVNNIYNNVTINSGAITRNTSSSTSGSAGNGGGVYVFGNTFTMNGGTISDNNAAGSSAVGYGNGGGIYITNGGKLTYTSGTISGNTAKISGKSIYSNNNSTVTGITLNGGNYEDGDIPPP